MKLLEIENLKTTFSIEDGIVQAVRGISFSVEEGESVGIVGESGSGKSVSMLSILRLLGDTADIQADKMFFKDFDLLKASKNEMRKIRGKEIGVIFQDPMTSLNPVYTIGTQLTEPLMLHMHMNRTQAESAALDLLKDVGIPSPESRIKQYPYELSGGLRQRVMIAIAMSCEPKLLIADEPTTALDVTIQAQILDLMKEIRDNVDSSIIMITHDLGVIADICRRVIVMYGGTIVEEGTIDDIFYSAKHPYTKGLLNSIPKIKSGKYEKLHSIPGQPPDLVSPPQGCPFTARCSEAMKICAIHRPNVREISAGHRAACWLLDKRASGVKNG